MFSWVPPAVREKLLSICSDNLTDDGVVYTSYNVLPGWHRLIIESGCGFGCQRARVEPDIAGSLADRELDRAPRDRTTVRPHFHVQRIVAGREPL